MASTFPKVKEKLLLKELGVYDRIHFAQAKLHETNITVESPRKWTSTDPGVEISERQLSYINSDMELKAIGDTFSKIF